MSLADIVNGAFEVAGGLAVVQNCRRLTRDKQVRGIDWRVTGFFTVWGLWNLYFYPSLHQWFSFAGGVVIVLGNFWWLSLAVRYRRR